MLLHVYELLALRKHKIQILFGFIDSTVLCLLLLYINYIFIFQSPKVRLPAPGVIKVGDKAIDDHSMRSTMRGETADMVNKFRELKLKEYCQITKLCKMNGIILSERLLEKGININF